MSIDHPTSKLDQALGAEERANERVCALEDEVAALREALRKCGGGAGVKTPPVTLCNSSSRGQYTGGDAAAPSRACADNALAVPSRVGNRLHHRCGRTTDLAGNPCEA